MIHDFVYCFRFLFALFLFCFPSLSSSFSLTHTLLNSPIVLGVIEHISYIFYIHLVNRSLYLAQHLILLFHHVLQQFAHSSVDVDHRDFFAEPLVPGTVCGKPSIELHRSCFGMVMITVAISVHISMVILVSIRVCTFWSPLQYPSYIVYILAFIFDLVHELLSLTS